jgi:Na+/proline symporter
MIKIMCFSFYLNYLPKGLIGLLLAVIISAAMSSTASGLNALASTTAIDIYKRNLKKKNQKDITCTQQNFSLYCKCYCILLLVLVPYLKIQLVNIIGSIFYGTVLGFFWLVLYQNVQSKAIFYSAVISQLTFILLLCHLYFSQVEKKTGLPMVKFYRSHAHH